MKLSLPLAVAFGSSILCKGTVAQHGEKDDKKPIYTPFPTWTPKPTTSAPTLSPTTRAPTDAPSFGPTFGPTVTTSPPTRAPTQEPSSEPTIGPTTLAPTSSPTHEPSSEPTLGPTPMPERFVCRVDTLYITETKGDSGSTEEWRVNSATISLGEGTRSNQSTIGIQDAPFSLEASYGGGECNPPDNQRLAYRCLFSVDGSRSGADWCVNADEDSFTFGVGMLVGDYDFGFDNGPRFTFENQLYLSNMPPNVGQVWWGKSFATGPEGRRGRIQTKCTREVGSCDGIGYNFDGNGKGYRHSDQRLRA